MRNAPTLRFVPTFQNNTSGSKNKVPHVRGTNGWDGMRGKWYKSKMRKIIEQWLLFKYVEGQFTPLSKPFKTKAAAEKARLKYSERERRSVAVGLIRIKR